MRTKTEESLASAEKQHADDPERAGVLSCARRFKASWLELAEALSLVRKAGHWKRWGYGSFEDYTRKELHLRQETVEKLTGSFLFLQKSAPKVLDRNGVGSPIPSYQAIDFLRRAEEVEGVPEEAMSEIRRKVLDDVSPLPALTRKYRELVFPVDDETKRGRELTSLRSAARRLRELLAASSVVPRKLSGEVDAALDHLLAALGDDEAQAA